MCTLIAGVGVLGPGTLAVAANRDEDPSRPSDPPGVLSLEPRVVGGRDAVAGGTWLALREGRAVVAVLNRRGPAPAAHAARGPAASEARSRGRLVLDVACIPATSGPDPAGAGPAAPDLAAAAVEAARDSLRFHRYSPLSLAFLSPERCWVLGLAHGAPRLHELRAGWHVLTHAELDDPAEPRTARLLRELRGFEPPDSAACAAGLRRLLALHAGEGTTGPAVCVHDGRMVTVSSSIVMLGPGSRRYLHVEGRPCETEPQDLTHLIEPAAPGRNRTNAV